jgi:hypothetical protein
LQVPAAPFFDIRDGFCGGVLSETMDLILLLRLLTALCLRLQHS